MDCETQETRLRNDRKMDPEGVKDTRLSTRTLPCPRAHRTVLEATDCAAGGSQPSVPKCSVF